MAWAWVCASCCQQLAKAVLPTGVGAEERTPLLGPAPASQALRPLILRDLSTSTPSGGSSCTLDGFSGTDPPFEQHMEVGLSTDSSYPKGPGATGTSWPAAVLLADLEQHAKQREHALTKAASAGLAPVKPEASWSSSPGPTSCGRTRKVAEAETRGTGSAGPGPEQLCFHGSLETPEPRKGQLLTAPGGLWDCEPVG